MRSSRELAAGARSRGLAATPTGGAGLDKLPGPSCRFVPLNGDQQSDRTPVLGDHDPLPLSGSLQVIAQMILQGLDTDFRHHAASLPEEPPPGIGISSQTMMAPRDDPLWTILSTFRARTAPKGGKPPSGLPPLKESRVSETRGFRGQRRMGAARHGIQR